MLPWYEGLPWETIADLHKRHPELTLEEMAIWAIEASPLADELRQLDAEVYDNPEPRGPDEPLRLVWFPPATAGACRDLIAAALCLDDARADTTAEHVEDHDDGPAPRRRGRRPNTERDEELRRLVRNPDAQMLELMAGSTSQQAKCRAAGLVLLTRRPEVFGAAWQPLSKKIQKNRDEGRHPYAEIPAAEEKRMGHLVGEALRRLKS